MKILSEILKLPNNETKVIELDNYVFELEQSKGFASLTDTEKVIFCIENLEREVNNGGFDQFFINTSGNYWKDTVTALLKISAVKTHTLLIQALSIFSNGAPSVDRNTRIDEVNALTEKEEFLNDLDQQFYKYEENIGGLLLSYIDTHLEDFSAK